MDDDDDDDDDDDGDDIMLYWRISPVGTVGDTPHRTNRDMLEWYCRSNVQTQQMLTLIISKWLSNFSKTKSPFSYNLKK